MDERLGLGQTSKDRKCAPSRVVVERCVAQQLHDLVVAALGVLPRLLDHEAHAADHAGLSRHDRDRDANDAERRYGSLDDLERHAQVDQRGHGHVTRDAAEAVEVQELARARAALEARVTEP